MSLPAGTPIGAYEILAAIGAGGMGTVYRARDTRLDRLVALKLLPEQFAADPDRLRRFEQEARAASALNHPNIVTIYEIGRHGDAPFIAMELVDGRTVRQLLERGPLSPKGLLDIAVQLTEALAKAHAAGIVHRDLKPENLMVTADGYVKVLDFGLAKLTNSAPGSGSEAHTQGGPTATGVVMGTAGYMSPEQAQALPLDFRSDQFACGAIIYEMATGRRAFQRASAVQTLSAIIEHEPEPVARINPAVPAPVAWIVERCLAKNPNARYASTADLAREVRSVREHLSEITSTADSVAPRGSLRRWSLAGGTVAALAILALLAGVSLRPDRATREPGGVGAAESGPRYVAIGAFRNLAGDPEGDAFSEGLTEAILTRLMDFRGVYVVPESAGIGAPLLLEGGVQRAGSTLRITYRLVRRKENVQLGGGIVDGDLEHIFALQDRVAAGVAEKIQEALGGAPLADASGARPAATADVTAYSFYLQGRGYLRQRRTPQDVDFAIALFTRALERDPAFALAHAGLGQAYWEKYHTTNEATWVDRAQAACERALALDANLAEAHVALGTIHLGTGRHEEAAAAFTRAISFDTRSDDAYRGLAAVYEEMGEPELAEQTYRRAIEIRPDYWRGYSWLGAFYYKLGRYEEAAAQMARVVELTPDNPTGYSSLGGLYHLLGRFEEAEAMLLKSVFIQPSPTGYTNLGTFYFFQGRYADAVPMMEKAVELSPKDYMYWGNLADAHRWASGSKAMAPEAYRRAIELGEEALRVNPKDAGVRANLAGYHARLGERDRALAQLDRALGLAAANSNILFDAVIVQEVIGDREAALRALERALASGYSLEEIRREPELAGLRQDPRFERLVTAR